jgi:hypothetical protein
MYNSCSTPNTTAPWLNAPGRTPRRQERIDLDDTEPVIEHKPLDVLPLFLAGVNDSGGREVPFIGSPTSAPRTR